MFSKREAKASLESSILIEFVKSWYTSIA